MPSRKKPRILLVEDNDELREITATILVEEGYDVLGLANGQEAIRHVLVDKKRPDLIILDLMMPKVSGLEFLAVRATNDHAKKIPVIVMSAMPLEGAMPAGTIFLAKPVLGGALTKTVAAVLAKHAKKKKKPR